MKIIDDTSGIVSSVYVQSLTQFLLSDMGNGAPSPTGCRASRIAIVASVEEPHLELVRVKLAETTKKPAYLATYWFDGNEAAEGRYAFGYKDEEIAEKIRSDLLYFIGPAAAWYFPELPPLSEEDILIHSMLGVTRSEQDCAIDLLSMELDQPDSILPSTEEVTIACERLKNGELKVESPVTAKLVEVEPGAYEVRVRCTIGTHFQAKYSIPKTTFRAKQTAAVKDIIHNALAIIANQVDASHKGLIHKEETT